MTPSISSYRVHMIVEYLKCTGFDYETHEILDTGIGDILQRYDLFVSLSLQEEELLQDELMLLAEQNEIRESLIKTREYLGLDWELMHITPTRASFYGYKRSPVKGVL